MAESRGRRWEQEEESPTQGFLWQGLQCLDMTTTPSIPAKSPPPGVRHHPLQLHLPLGSS